MSVPYLGAWELVGRVVTLEGQTGDIEMEFSR